MRIRSRRWVLVEVLVALLAAMHSAQAQVVLTGRIEHPRTPGGLERMPLSAILTVASRDGGDSQSLAFRTWETEPAGWFRMSGGAGRYTLAFSNPAHFMRPLVLTNVFLRSGESFDRRVSPRLELFNFHEQDWDRAAGERYVQTFVARGTSLTQVGFRLAHDGVDGAGPGKQTLLVSIHRRGEGTPDRWPQVGPTVPIVDVDSGGPKNYLWSAGWNSGEAPLVPGEMYAVSLQAETPGGVFQPFWRADDDTASDCYRTGGKGPSGFQRHDLWLAISADGDGLAIPYNKRVHKEFGELTHCINRWSQTYVARGRSLAVVTLYAAVSGAQPPLARQRVAVSVRRGGPDGPQVGVTKIAVGNGNYTGDASWGVFQCAFSPGEVPLAPGETYAVDFRSIENYNTLHGFVNVKGQVSDDRPGFNPYKKHPRDAYDAGTAYMNGTQKVDFDLDMQVIEYEHSAGDWHLAVDDKNLLEDGDMELGIAAAGTEASRAPWHTFAIMPGTEHSHASEPPENKNRFLRVAAAAGAKAIDGGFVQRVAGLSTSETYRAQGRVRCSWPVDETHQGMVGYDPTGQTDDPRAPSIAWTLLPDLHGTWVERASEPVRPKHDAISIWLRGRAASMADKPLRADFDQFSLRRVRTEAPGGAGGSLRSTPGAQSDSQDVK